MFKHVLSKLGFGLAAVVFLASLPVAAAVNDAALMSARPAKLLSEYGLFTDAALQAPAEGVVPYGLITPLFTDYAHKYRFVYVPKGTKASYDGKEVMHFPTGSALLKTFAYPADFRSPEKDIRLIETRLLIRQEKGWNAWAYVWDAALGDAVLKVAGKTLPVSWLDETGAERSTNYVVPNKNQCKGCHTLDKVFSPIGPKARNLNRDFTYTSGTANQLDHWSALGLLEGAPASGDAPKVPEFDDAAAPLDARARAYLDINCAHCHRLEGPASTSGLFLTWDEDNKTTWGYKKRPVAAGRGSGGLAYDIMPGEPENSILVYRLNSVDPGVMMPEVGRTMVHTEGVALLKEWIASIE
ncbi:SO2930 family diheme c-type cytochrome [Kordiimonas sp.]|uniref:SO2930 family diheme c-type cytochrome n=1 Tax=Kordiimonas sp. TaxID=1970157 RepID=UPI003A928D9B